MKVLIVKLSSMGDVLHALPAALEIKRQWGAEIHWAVHPVFAGLVRCFPCVDHIVEIPRRGGLSLFRQAVRRLRENKYDWVVDFQGLFKSAVLVRLARTDHRVGPGFWREGARLFYDAVPKRPRPRRHAVEECLDLLPVLGLTRPETPEFRLSPPELSPGTAGEGKLRIAIAPVSRWTTKNWPLERFAETARRLVREMGAEVHILGGGADRPDAEELARLAGVEIRNHCGEFDLPHSCALLRHMDALVTNDSGPMHLAAAMNIPCVALFGPTLPGRTGPYGPIHRVLQSDSCAPCYRRTCPRGDFACLRDISVDRVMDAVRKTVGGRA